MKIHPIAEIFPRMSDADFAALREDIDMHGLREPVWTWKGQIIDGRHRYQACEELGIKKCAMREYEGDESGLVAFVLSLNLKRRHLNASQRAMVAASIANMPAHRPDENSANLQTSQADAARLLNVSTRTVASAAKVRKQAAPELVQAVEQGKMSVAAAADVAELPKSQQKRIVAQDVAKETASKMRAERKPKTEKPAEVEKLRAENEELSSQLAELAKQQEPLQDEVDFLRKIEDEGDKLKAACAEVKRLQELVRGQEERITGLMNEKREAVKAANSWKRKYEQAIKVAA